MKQLLLINPPQHHTISGNLPKYVDDSRGNIPPLGLLYTASAVLNQRKDWQVNICDMSAGDSLNYDKPDLVGITATTFTIIDVLEIAQQVKNKWDVPIVLGGIHPTIYPKESVNLPNIDSVYTGESESMFPQMIEHLAAKSVKIVAGESVNVESVPVPARQLLDTEKYYSVIGSNGYMTTMFTSRGCPFKCIFCHRETMGKRYRARTANQVIDEIKQIKNMGINEILIYDDTFTVDRARVINICEKLIDQELNIAFDIRARVDTIDKELLEWLKLAGCKRIHYGVEASNDAVLNVLQKGITLQQVYNAFRLTKRAGIETLAYFILGSPSENYFDMIETIRLAKELKPDYCHFAIMTPYPATPLYYQGLDEHRFSDYWLEFAKNPTKDFKAPYWFQDTDAMEAILDRAYKEFYLRPSYVLHEVIKTRSPRKFVKKAKSAIGIMTGGK